MTYQIQTAIVGDTIYLFFPLTGDGTIHSPSGGEPTEFIATVIFSDGAGALIQS